MSPTDNAWVHRGRVYCCCCCRLTRLESAHYPHDQRRPSIPDTTGEFVLVPGIDTNRGSMQSEQNLATRVLPTAAMWTLLRACQALATASLGSQVCLSPSCCRRAATASVCYAYVVSCGAIVQPGCFSSRRVSWLTTAPIKTFT